MSNVINKYKLKAGERVSVGGRQIANKKALAFDTCGELYGVSNYGECFE